MSTLDSELDDAELDWLDELDAAVEDFVEDVVEGDY